MKEGKNKKNMFHNFDLFQHSFQNRLLLHSLVVVDYYYPKLFLTPKII